ncbi:MAG: YvrJ family protein [Proteocatella sp.]
MEDFIFQISNFGFPIAVSIYVLMRLETKMDKLSESISELTVALGKNLISH